MPRPTGLATSLAVSLIVAVVALAYSNSLDGPFLFDDIPGIRENRAIRQLWPLWPILKPANNGTTVDGRPLVNLSLALNYAVSELHVRGYHLTNLAIHLAAALTLLALLRHTFLLPSMPLYVRRAALPLAFSIALLWAVHPLQTESVTYLVQRAESLVGLFLLVTLYCLAKACDSPQRSGWSMACVAACTLGMASKEVMVGAPILAILYDRTFVSGSFRAAWQARGKLYLALAATWLLLILLVMGTPGRGRSAGFGQGVTVWQYALTQLPAITHYLRLCLWPRPLVLDYGTALVEPGLWLLPHGLLVAGLMVGTLLAVRNVPWLGFLGCFFWATLAPTSSIVPVVTQTMAEHRMYEPLAVVVLLCVLVPFLLYHLVRRKMPVELQSLAAKSRLVTPRRAAWAIVFAAALAMAVQTYARNVDYRSPEAMWRDTMEKRPDNARALTNYALGLLDRDDPSGALPYLDRAVSAQPNYFQAYSARGSAHMLLGNYQASLADHDRAVEIYPIYANAWYNRGLLHSTIQDWEAARGDYTVAIDLGTIRPDSFRMRGEAWRRLNKPQLAIEDYTQAIARSEEPSISYFGRAQAHEEAGDLHSAIQDYTNAIAAQPGQLLYYHSRAHCYLKLRDLPAAQADWQKVLSLGGPPDPALEQALSDLAQGGQD
ncbi:MAG: tetratricopeptide repeat protein [Pirellulales bacterium]